MLKRMALGIASQGFNSIGNMLLAFWVAKTSTTSDFGAWSIGYAGYMMALQAMRALAATPLLIEPEGRREGWHARASVGLAGVIGLISTFALFLAGMSFPSVRAQLWVFAAAVPVLLIQDALRHVAFSRERSDLATAVDALWLAVQIGFSWAALSLWPQASTSQVLTGAWAGAALASAAAGAMLLRVGVGLADADRYRRRTAHLSGPLLGDAALAAAGSQSLPVVVAAISGLGATGALRGGLTLMGALNILITGLGPVATMEAKKHSTTPAAERRFVLGWSLGLAVIAALYGIGLLLLPDRVGRAAIGATWEPARLLLLPLVLEGLVRGPWSGVPLVLRAQLRVGLALRLRIVTTISLLFFPIVGTFLDGAKGAAWGILVSSIVSSAASMLALGRRGSASQRRALAQD